MNILRDPIWQFIGVIIAILFPLLLYVVQRNRKEVAYEIVSNTPILSLRTEVKGKVQVLLDNKPVNEARLVILRIWNSGNQPIRTEDYDQKNPIKFNFGSGTEVLDADILETIPSDLKSRSILRLNSESIEIEPLLLNRKDSIKIKLLISRFNGDISIDGRIVGVKQISIFTNKSSALFALFTIVYCLLFVPAFLLAVILIFNNIIILRIVSIICIILLMSLLILLFMRVRTFKRAMKLWKVKL